LGYGVLSFIPVFGHDLCLGERLPLIADLHLDYR
jgi:hypothetical protein